MSAELQTYSISLKLDAATLPQSSIAPPEFLRMLDYQPVEYFVLSPEISSAILAARDNEDAIYDLAHAVIALYLNINILLVAEVGNLSVVASSRICNFFNEMPDDSYVLDYEMAETIVKAIKFGNLNFLLETKISNSILEKFKTFEDFLQNAWQTLLLFYQLPKDTKVYVDEVVASL